MTVAQAVELLASMDSDQASEFLVTLGTSDASKAVEIMNTLSTEQAAGVLKSMHKDQAGEILNSMDVSKVGNAAVASCFDFFFKYSRSCVQAVMRWTWRKSSPERSCLFFARTGPTTKTPSILRTIQLR